MSDDTLSRALMLARVALRFARVERSTRHEDGVRVETDTDHTVMLALVACELAPAGLDRAKIAAFAVVHDLVEVYAGDAQTMVISAEARAAKKDREDAARARLVADLGDGSWIAETLVAYEEQRAAEARFVRLTDKILPNLTHALNGCVAAMSITDRAGFSDARARQLRELASEYPEFPEALELLRASMLQAEACWAQQAEPASSAALRAAMDIDESQACRVGEEIGDGPVAVKYGTAHPDGDPRLLAPGAMTRLELSDEASWRARGMPPFFAALAAALAPIALSIIQADSCEGGVDEFGRRRPSALRARRRRTDPCPSCGLPTLAVSAAAFGAPEAARRTDHPRPGSICAVCRRMAHPIVWRENAPVFLSALDPVAAGRTG